MEFRRCGTWKISQIDGILSVWYLKIQTDAWNSILIVPEKLVIRLNPIDRMAKVTELPEAHIWKK